MKIHFVDSFPLGIIIRKQSICIIFDSESFLSPKRIQIRVSVCLSNCKIHLCWCVGALQSIAMQISTQTFCQQMKFVAFRYLNN